MNVGFERIQPAPGYPAGTSALALSGLSWSSRAGVVVLFKSGLKTALRNCQAGRCCFCRRLLYDDYAVHLEHFVDQASHPEHRFEIRNLALACGTCNIKKNGYFSTWSARYKRLNGNQAVRQTPTLKIQLNVGTPYPTSPSYFRWVNPYVHRYSDHVSLARGWVFTGHTREGRRTVHGLRLNDLAEVERRALTERLEMRGGRLSMLVVALGELEQHRARVVASAVVAVLARRRKANVASA